MGYRFSLRGTIGCPCPMAGLLSIHLCDARSHSLLHLHDSECEPTDDHHVRSVPARPRRLHGYRGLSCGHGVTMARLARLDHDSRRRARSDGPRGPYRLSFRTAKGALLCNGQSFLRHRDPQFHSGLQQIYRRIQRAHGNPPHFHRFESALLLLRFVPRFASILACTGSSFPEWATI